MHNDIKKECLLSHLRKQIIGSKYHQQENKFTNLSYIYTMKYIAMKANYIELHSLTWINHVSLLIKIKTMFLTLIWWSSESLLFKYFFSFLLSFCLLMVFPLLIFVTSSLDTLFFFQYFFSLPFHSGSFYRDIVNSEIISSAMSNLLISPSKALFISSIVFFISSFLFSSFLRFSSLCLHCLSFSAFFLLDSLEP